MSNRFFNFFSDQSPSTIGILSGILIFCIITICVFIAVIFEQQADPTLSIPLIIAMIFAISIGVFVRKFLLVSSSKMKHLENGAEVDVFAEDTSPTHEEAEISRLRLREAIENISEGFVLYDKNLRLIICNQKFKDLYGYSDEEAARGAKFSTLARLDEERGRLVLDHHENSKLFERYSNGSIGESDIIIQLVDDRWLQVRDRVTFSGNIVSLQAEITDLKRAEEKILHMANHDALTSLPTLRLGTDRLSKSLESAHRDKEMVAVFFIDLDAFKDINDEQGHDAGDHVLKEVALRLGRCIREMDTAARIGGDEFLVILSSVTRMEGVKRIGDNIITSVSRPISWNGDELSVSASIGIALYPDHGETTEGLIKRADTAMYDAKKKGKNCYVLANTKEH